MSKRKQGRTVIVTCKRCGEAVKSSEVHIVVADGSGEKSLLCGGCWRFWTYYGITDTSPQSTGNPVKKGE